MLVFLAGCGEHATGPAFGTAEIDITTIGEDISSRGYVLSVDGKSVGLEAVNDTVTLSGLRAGGHAVLLAGIPLNCDVIGQNPSWVIVTLDSMVRAPIRIGCRAFDTLHVLTLNTYDSSGQVVHPDVVRTPGFRQFPLWMAVTPFPFGRASYENPSVFHGEDPLVWSVPPGLTNPIAKPPSGYYSDPDVGFSASRSELWIYFRQVALGQNIILSASSQDGVHWSPPISVIAVPNHELVSPAVVRGAPHSVWQMWSVNSGALGCRALTTSVERRTSLDGRLWTGPQRVGLQQPGFNIWHIEVQWLPSRGEYWALYNVYPPGSSCVTPRVYLATSTDGVTWTTFPSPVLSHGVIDEFRDVVYRSTFEYDAGSETITFWFSGSKYNGTTYAWHMATQTRRVADLLLQVQSPQPAAVARPWVPGRQLPPPEPADTLP